MVFDTYIRIIWKYRRNMHLHGEKDDPKPHIMCITCISVRDLSNVYNISISLIPKRPR